MNTITIRTIRMCHQKLISFHPPLATIPTCNCIRTLLASSAVNKTIATAYSGFTPRICTGMEGFKRHYLPDYRDFVGKDGYDQSNDRNKDCTAQHTHENH